MTERSDSLADEAQGIADDHWQQLAVSSYALRFTYHALAWRRRSHDLIDHAGSVVATERCRSFTVDSLRYRVHGVTDRRQRILDRATGRRIISRDHGDVVLANGEVLAITMSSFARGSDTSLALMQLVGDDGEPALAVRHRDPLDAELRAAQPFPMSEAILSRPDAVPDALLLVVVACHLYEHELVRMQRSDAQLVDPLE